MKISLSTTAAAAVMAVLALAPAPSSAKVYSQAELARTTARWKRFHSFVNVTRFNMEFATRCRQNWESCPIGIRNSSTAEENSCNACKSKVFGCCSMCYNGTKSWNDDHSDNPLWTGTKGACNRDPAKFVGVSVCANEKSPPQLLIDQEAKECSTGPTHNIEGTSDNDGNWNPKRRAPQSLLRLLDFDNFTSPSCLEAKNKTGDPNLDCDPKVQGWKNVWWMAKDLMKYDSFSQVANVLEGGVTVDPTAGAIWAMSPYVTGNYTCRGINGQSFTLATDVRIYADPPFSMSYQGGRVAVVGGINMGKAPILFNTSDKVESFGMNNYGNVKFQRSQDIRFYNSVNHAAGKVHFKGVHASLLNSVNHGKIIVEDGTYNVFKSFNKGEILVKGDTTVAVVRSDGNTGKLKVEGGTFDVVAMLNEGQVDVSGNTQVTATLVYNKGAITIADGVTGTLKLLGKNTGKLTVPATGFTVIDKSFAEKKAEQKIALKNICARDVTKEARDALVAAIAKALNVPTFQVEIKEIKDAAGSSCSSRRRRRLGRHLSGANSKVEVVYNVAFIKGEDQTATKTAMASIGTGTAMSEIVDSVTTATGIKVEIDAVQAVQETAYTPPAGAPAGTPSTSPSPTPTPTPKSSGSNGGGGESSNDMLIYIGGAAGGILVMLLVFGGTQKGKVESK